jgi:hypothetical protein
VVMNCQYLIVASIKVLVTRLRLKTCTSFLRGRVIVGKRISHKEEAQLTGGEGCAEMFASIVTDWNRFSETVRHYLVAMHKGLAAPPILRRQQQRLRQSTLARHLSAVIASGFLTKNLGDVR